MTGTYGQKSVRFRMMKQKMFLEWIFDGKPKLLTIMVLLRIQPFSFTVRCAFETERPNERHQHLPDSADAGQAFIGPLAFQLCRHIEFVSKSWAHTYLLLFFWHHGIFENYTWDKGKKLFSADSVLVCFLTLKLDSIVTLSWLISICNFPAGMFINNLDFLQVQFWGC